MSLLSWERGLKYARPAETEQYNVAPLVGAWIEISPLNVNCAYLSSLLSWERGLKYHYEILVF